VPLYNLTFLFSLTIIPILSRLPVHTFSLHIYLPVMFKASIQRQVRLGSVARQFSSFSLMRSTRSEKITVLCQTTSHTALRHLAPSHAAFSAFSRLYSAESAAAQANREGEFAAVSSAPASRFSELSQLGVNDRLVEALTKGMGYDNMTEVQSMAINPALKGTDM
jgi:ATP-dependent RNA helicase MSS116